MWTPRRIVGSVAGVALAGVLVWRVNAIVVNDPVQTMIGESPANGFRVNAHFAYFVNPFVLVLDLRGADSTAPTVLFRSVLGAAHAMRVAYRPFGHVVLAHHGKTIFTMGGSEFDAMGAAFERGQNRDYLVARMVGMLRTPAGTPAYQPRQLGASHQFAAAMDDARDAARRWAAP